MRVSRKDVIHLLYLFTSSPALRTLSRSSRLMLFAVSLTIPLQGQQDNHVLMLHVYCFFTTATDSSIAAVCFASTFVPRFPADAFASRSFS
jgi:hypothetical protein